MSTIAGKAINPSVEFREEIEAQTGQRLSLCYQCKKCSGGCPMNFAMDYRVHEVIRLIQLGARELVLSSNSFWLCTGCKTCKARCPNDIDGSQLMDALKTIALAKGKPASPTVPAFNESFLATVRGFGRVYDLGMMALYKAKTGSYAQDVKLGLELFKRGKLRVLPERIKGVKQVRLIFRLAREDKS